MKLGIVVPLWRREELTRLTLQRIAREVEGDKDCILVAITDEEINGQQAREYGFEVVSVPNKPLSDKKNAGIEHLRGRVDGVVLLGSDDWGIGLDGVPLLARYRSALSIDAFVGPLDMWFLDLQSGKASYFPGYQDEVRLGEPIGVGRAIRADVLDAIDWKPRPSGLTKNHDGAMRNVIREAGYPPAARNQEELGIRLVDIKSDISVSAFPRLWLIEHSWNEILSPFPDEEVEELLALHGKPWSR